MIELALMLFGLAGCLSLYSATCFLLENPPGLAVGILRTSLALVAFGLFVGWLAIHHSPEPLALYALVVFLVVALIGGLLRFVPHVFNERLPRPVILLQSMGALVGYGLVIFSFLK